MAKITHIVETFLWDRPTWTMPESYLKYRLDFFHKYTLRSLMNQTCQKFIILMQLGKKNFEITEKYNWYKKVYRSYEMGKEIYENIDSQFLVITRIDSDDLFHKNAIDIIRNNLKFNHKERSVLVFKKNLCWDMINDCVMPHRKATSPFFTHIFPKSIYQNWEKFKEQHFCEHGNHGAGDKTGYELPPNHVCVVKHSQNVSLMKHDLPAFTLSEQQKMQLRKTGKSESVLPAYDEAIWDKEIMKNVLSDFGVEYEG